jgi:hypothetical protein
MQAYIHMHEHIFVVTWLPDVVNSIVSYSLPLLELICEIYLNSLYLWNGVITWYELKDFILLWHC